MLLHSSDSSEIGRFWTSNFKLSQWGDASVELYIPSSEPLGVRRTRHRVKATFGWYLHNSQVEAQKPRHSVHQFA